MFYIPTDAQVTALTRAKAAWLWPTGKVSSQVSPLPRFTARNGSTIAFPRNYFGLIVGPQPVPTHGPAGSQTTKSR